jgi:hypothetical protein
MFQRTLTFLHYVKGGHGQQVVPQIPWISSDWTSFASPVGEMPKGTFWYDEFGNVFTLKIARASGVVQGATVKWNPPSADTVAASPAPTLGAVALTTGSPYTGANADAGNLLYNNSIAVGTVGTNKFDALKWIKANGAGAAGVYTVSLLDSKYANLQFDPDAYLTVPTSGNVTATIRPYEILVTATTDLLVIPCVGVAVQAISNNTWGFTQVAGLAQTQASGSVTAIVANNAVVLDGVTAGTVKGSAALAAGQVGISAVANSTIASVIPVWLTIGYNA